MPVASSPQNEWRSPTGGDTLSFADEQYSPSRKENATHGQVYRTGRPRVKLHGGRGGPERAADSLAGGGDERRDAGGGGVEGGVSGQPSYLRPHELFHGLPVCLLDHTRHGLTLGVREVHQALQEVVGVVVHPLKTLVE